MNQRVDVWENNKQYQNTLSYASSKASYSIRLSMHMLPSNMNLNIMPRTVRYHNKILVSDSGLSLGKNNVTGQMCQRSQSIKQLSCMAIKKSIVQTQSKHTSGIMHEDEKIRFGTGSNWCFWNMVCFSLMRSKKQGDPIEVTSEC